MKEQEFDKSKVKYPGYIEGSSKFQVDQEKVQSMEDWPASTSNKELQQFLGLAKYYKRFIRVLCPYSPAYLQLAAATITMDLGNRAVADL